MPAYKMFSDGFLTRFKNFVDVERHNPEGAFDTALTKTQPRKQNTMPYRFVPLAGTGGTLFLRERSSNMAYDSAEEEISAPAKRILAFLKNKLDEDTLHEVGEYLKAEAGIETDLQKESRAKIEAAKERGATAQDARRRNRGPHLAIFSKNYAIPS
jgi:hypothetical protein